jgi:hypothetical protein
VASRGRPLVVTVALTAATTYFVFVDGASDSMNQAGVYTLGINRDPVQFDVSAVDVKQ